MDSETPRMSQADIDNTVQPHMQHLLYEVRNVAAMPWRVVMFDTYGPPVLKVACLELALQVGQPEECAVAVQATHKFEGAGNAEG